MTIYKPSGYDSDVKSGLRKKYFHSGSKPTEGANESYHCGHCGEKCYDSSRECNKCSRDRQNESSKRPQTEFNYSDSKFSNNNFSNNNDAFVLQDASQYSFMDQESAELIWVKESCNITVTSTDTQAAVSLQAGLQLAIALVINISIADSSQRDAVAQEMMQQFSLSQTNKQKIFIYNTKDAVVTTQDTDLAINIQALLQVLLALVLLIDIL